MIWIHETVLCCIGAKAFVTFVVIGLVVELALLGATYRVVAGAADAGAEAGAAMLSEAHAYRSELVIDAPRAVREADRTASALAGLSAAVDVDAQPLEVCVVVTRSYRPVTLAFLGLADVDVRVTSCAEPRVG